MSLSLQDMSHPLSEHEATLRHPTASQVGDFAPNKSEDDEDEDQKLIAWELKWWKNEGAVIIH
jgi:hypothetical protein